MLHEVTSPNTGARLREALEFSQNEKLFVCLNGVLQPNDASCVKYHNKCWMNNVVNTLRCKKAQKHRQS